MHQPLRTVFSHSETWHGRTLLSIAFNNLKITEEDSKYISQFVNELRASNNIGKGRVVKIVSVLINWRRVIDDYDFNKIEDLYSGIEDLKDPNKWGRSLRQNTLRDYIMFLKRFYKWLIENKHSSIPLEKIEKIKAPGCDLMTKTAGDLLDEMEILAMINASQNNRDRPSSACSMKEHSG